MKKFARRSIHLKSAVAMAMFLAASVAHSSSTSDNQSLQRGAVEDVTPQQKYRSAIREAGGAYKESLRDCNRTPGFDRRACTLDAKVAYDRDMAEARLILRGR